MTSMRTANNSGGNPVCKRCSRQRMPVRLMMCSKYSCERVMDESSKSKMNPLAALFSFMTMTPFSLKPSLQRRKNATKSSSVKCPMHH